MLNSYQLQAMTVDFFQKCLKNSQYLIYTEAHYLLQTRFITKVGSVVLIILYVYAITDVPKR
jgi:hypothetical protein